MKVNLSPLEIHILLKCKQKLLSRSALSQIRRKESKTNREKAISNLIKQGLINVLELPHPDATITPVFYEITDKGKAWVKDYLDSYPKK